MKRSSRWPGTDVEYYGQDVAYVVAETYEQARQRRFTLVRVKLYARHSRDQ